LAHFPNCPAQKPLLGVFQSQRPSAGRLQSQDALIQTTEWMAPISDQLMLACAHAARCQREKQNSKRAAATNKRSHRNSRQQSRHAIISQCTPRITSHPMKQNMKNDPVHQGNICLCRLGCSFEATEAQSGHGCSHLSPCEACLCTCIHN